ncbi:Uncharacterized protein Fot_28782 [Forsythia ovata]|uniref:Uncharacterized protein n=1 Tax=Forsythia ovata TaxID=205694 RepID=A0ABD1TPZ6_9LAMI
MGCHETAEILLAWLVGRSVLVQLLNGFPSNFLSANSYMKVHLDRPRPMVRRLVRDGKTTGDESAPEKKKASMEGRVKSVEIVVDAMVYLKTRSREINLLLPREWWHCARLIKE